MSEQESILSRVRIGRHPLHPMVVHFPVAALIGLAGTDLAFVLSADLFWARAGLWLAGVGAAGGWVASSIGIIDLVTVRRIRWLITAWCHAILAVMLLSLATMNWLLRFDDMAAHLLPWGLSLSLASVALIGVTSALGGQLVYEHAVGVNA